MTKDNKLGTLKLSGAEKAAIASMVDSPGFRVWRQKIMPNREIKIAGTLVNTGQDEKDLWYFKGRSVENEQIVKELLDIAKSAEEEQV